MKLKTIFLYTLSPFLLFFVKTNAQTSIELKKIIHEKYSEYISQFSKKDYSGIANLYTADGARLAKGEPNVTGRDSIAKSLKDMFAVTGPVSVIIQRAELWLMDEKLYEAGKWFYSWMGKDSKTVLVQGDYLTIWKQSEGDWKIWRDIGF